MKNRVCISLFSVFIFSGLIFSCAGFKNFTNAVSISADAISAAKEDINPEQEYYIGRAVAANLLSTYKIYDGKPALTTYLNNICTVITINSPRPDIYNGYHVAILNTPEVNAFATPGGHIYVTRGLIANAKSEDALAAVIAHEVAHIQLKHSIEAIKKSRSTQALMVTGTAMAGVAGGMDVKQLTDALNDSFMEIVQTLVQNGYAQEQEFAADKTAMALMANAGYNPAGLIDMLMALGSVVQSSDTAGFGKTHPSPRDRIANAEKSVKSYKFKHGIGAVEARKKRYALAMK